DRLEGFREIRDLEEQHRLVRRWIVLNAAPFETNEGGASLKPGVMASLLLGQVETKHVCVELSGARQVIEVELDTDQLPVWLRHAPSDSHGASRSPTESPDPRRARCPRCPETTRLSHLSHLDG